MNNNFSPSEDRLTPEVKKTILLTIEEATKNNTLVFPEDIILTLIDNNFGATLSIFNKLKVNIEKLTEKLKIVHKSNPKNNADELKGEMLIAPITKKALSMADKESKRLRQQFIGTEHLILGIIAEGNNNASLVLHSFNITSERFNQVAFKDLDDSFLTNIDDMELDERSDKQRKILEELSSFAINSTETINNYCIDISEMAEKNTLDPVIGREEEIKRVIQIINRRTKNNPILIGNAGVGKTAIVEGLAQAIHHGKVPHSLQNKRIFALDLPLMLAGTKYRGQFEERIKDLMQEVKDNPYIILFIDEIHTIIGAGSAEGAMDAANILKPALARGQIQCIGATTTTEYRKSIEKDPALDRRFQSIKVNPPSTKQTLKILNRLSEKYAEYHNVTYTPEALIEAVRLSERYIYDRSFPDKAIDVIDEAGSMMQMTNNKPPKKNDKLKKQLTKLAIKKLAAVSAHKYLQAGKIHQDEEAIKEEMKKNASVQQNPIIIDDEIIRTAIAKITNIPIEKLNKNEKSHLLKIEQKLNQQVIGQTNAVHSLARSLIRSKADLKDSNKPIGSYLFLGPTGVGKTLLAKKLAEFMFHSNDAIIQIDMSEYMEKFSLSRLIGAPPGYVGFQEGGELTEKVRRNPYSIILFDEIEKAHPDISNILLQILEDGKITDSEGNVINFSNTIIILTSNIGARLIHNKGRLGFSNDKDESYEHLSKQVKAEAQKFFKPEFLNRLDDTLVFHSLDKTTLLKIVTIELKKTQKKLTSRNMKLKADNVVKKFILTKAHNPEFGARPIRRAIERYIDDLIADVILTDKLTAHSTINLSIKEDKISYTIIKDEI